MISELVIPKPIYRQMRRHVDRRTPMEACGLLAGKDGMVSISHGIRNDARSPVHYRMNPKGQLRAFNRFEDLGLDMLAIYHSHPAGPPGPSPTDIREAMYAVVYIIWSHRDDDWNANGFWIGENRQVSVVGLQIV
jgi:[CysO sulfur-carrier protein]-S-L-cysteine hydrolase